MDGFLLLNTPSEIRSPLPTVAISAHNNSPGVTNIILDHRKAAELALTHLYELGHRNIVFMKGPNIIPDTEYRWRSILEVAQQLGIKLQADHCIQLDADSWSPQVGYEPMRDLLARTRERRRTEDASIDTEVSRIDETIRELKERKEALAVFIADASTHERKATR